MAAGVYDTDLKNINLCETTTDFSALGGGGAGLSAGVDFAIQGTNAVDKQVSNSLKGMVYDTGSTITLGADEHILIWMICSTPGITSAQSAGGLRITVGTATNAYNEWYVNGNDTLPEGGMNNYAIHTSSAADNTQGSPGANPQVFGGQADVTATAKGVNFALDAMRYGTGLYITEGDATTPITFESASVVNDSNANRYGIFEAIPGGFSHKGRFVIGQDPNFNTTQSYFTDSNKNIVFKDTPKSLDQFTQLIVDHPSTFFDINGISFTAEGTNNRGQIVFNDSSTTGSIENCQFNNIGRTSLQANVQVTGSTWNNCDVVYQSGSSITTSTINNVNSTASYSLNPAVIVSDDPSLISFCNFNGDGSSFGMEIIVTGSYNFTGNKFTGFPDGFLQNNADIYFNPPGGTGDLTLNILGGGTSNLSVSNGGTSVTINSNVEITVTGLKDNTEVRIFDSATTGPQTELAGIENATDGTTDNRSFTFTLAVGTIVDIVLISVQYENERLDDFELTTTQDLPFEQVLDRNYDGISGYGNSLLVSLKDRAEFFENESATTTFLTDIGDELLNSASLVMYASGYSSTPNLSGSIQSLIPSSSDGDLLCDDENSNENVEANFEGLYFLNSSALLTSSSNGVPKLGYNYSGSEGHFYNIGKQQTKMQFPISFSSSFTAGSIFLNTPQSSSNVAYVAYANTTTTTGSISPLGDDSATLIIDNNSGGTNSASVAFSSSTFDFNQNNISFFVSSSGADYVWCSSSALPSSFWFNLQTGQTGSVIGPLTGSFLVTEYPNKWWRIAASMGARFNGLAAEDFIVGVGDSDNSKTFTSDGTKGISIWGFNNQTDGASQPHQGNFVNVEDGAGSTAQPPTQYYYNNLTTPCSNDGGGLYIEYKGVDSFLENGGIGTGGDAIGLTLQSTGASTDFLGILTNSDSVIGKDGIVLRWTSGSTATNLETSRVKVTGSGDYTDGYNYKYDLNSDYLRVAISWTPTSWKVSINGEIVKDVSKSISFVPAYDQFRLEGETRLKSVIVFPDPLTNDQLNTLTTF